MLVCSSVGSDAVDDSDELAAQLAAAAQRAGERGLRIAYEALAWGTHVSIWERSWDAVRRANPPALGLCLDSFHVLSRGGDPAGFAELPSDKLFFLQLADAPRLRIDVLQWSRHYRLFPGQGGFDLTSFLDHVLAAGYAGPLSLEVFNDVYRQADPARTAVDAMRSLLWLEECLATRRRPRACRHLRRPRPCRSTRSPNSASTAFPVRRLPKRSPAWASPTPVSTRSKPVRLWEQGHARVLLNASVVRPTGAGVASVAALGLESADPGRSAQRAQALRAPVLPRTRGTNEADLAAVAAPDDTQIFFTRTGPGGWPADFLPTGQAAGPGAGLTPVVHVGLTQPFDSFDEAARFYRAVLGLAPQTVTEFAAPFGLIRTRAITNDDRTVRLVLSVAALRRGTWAPGVLEPQYIAFATDDIVSAARRLRALGAAMLPIPANYADDLEARFDLAPAQVEAIPEYGLMFDEDENGGYLHLATCSRR